jgi:hypothetical protein
MANMRPKLDTGDQLRRLVGGQGKGRKSPSAARRITSFQFIPANMKRAIFPVEAKFQARAGTKRVDFAVNIFTDFPLQGNTVRFLLVGAFHTPQKASYIFGQFGRDSAALVWFCLAPVKGNAEMSTTCPTL